MTLSYYVRVSKSSYKIKLKDVYCKKIIINLIRALNFIFYLQKQRELQLFTLLADSSEAHPSWRPVFSPRAPWHRGGQDSQGAQKQETGIRRGDRIQTQALRNGKRAPQVAAHPLCKMAASEHCRVLS